MYKTKAINALRKVYPYLKNIFSSAWSLMLFIFRKDAGCCQTISADQDSPAMQTFARSIGISHVSILHPSRPEHPSALVFNAVIANFFLKAIWHIF